MTEEEYTIAVQSKLQDAWNNNAMKHKYQDENAYATAFIEGLLAGIDLLKKGENNEK